MGIVGTLLAALAAGVVVTLVLLFLLVSLLTMVFQDQPPGNISIIALALSLAGGIATAIRQVRKGTQR